MTDHTTLAAEFKARQRRDRLGLLLGAAAPLLALAAWTYLTDRPLPTLAASPLFVSASAAETPDAIAAMLAYRADICAAPVTAVADYRRTKGGQQDRLEDEDILPAIRGFCLAFGEHGAPRQQGDQPDPWLRQAEARIAALEAKAEAMRAQGAAEVLARMPGVSRLP